VPPEQVAPLLHAFPAQQTWPSSPQPRQAPPWQTVPVAQPGAQVPPQPSGPQLLPAQFGTQAQVPPVQVAPGSQTEPPQQAWPTAPHDVQLPPALQLALPVHPGGQVPPQPLGPQLLPAQLGVQAQVPPWQVVPALHAPAQQGWPAAPHPTHAPRASQASRLPQLVPVGDSPVTEQTDPPDEQVVCAIRHTGPLQATPAVQSTQVPVDEHTLFAPHPVPGATIPLSVQTGSPDVQAIRAV
jgi:hypothetical protein